MAGLAKSLSRELADDKILVNTVCPGAIYTDRLRSGTATVLDVRPEDEFAHGHVPDALNIPLAQLERRLAELPADQEIVAYCRGPWCVLSFEAVAVLRQRGYRVRRLEDGYPEWKMAGLPVESAVD